ncbi:MAG: DUF4249 family protein [Bacteroidota bacterium]
MHPKTHLAFLLLLTVSLLSCVDKIDLRQGEQLDKGIALSGRMRIENGLANVVFRAERLFLFESNRGEVVAGATITLETSEGAIYPLSYDLEERLFTANFPFSPIEGTTVQVRVITGAGDNYLSAPEAIPAPNIPESSTYEVIGDAGAADRQVRFLVTTNGRQEDGSGIPFLYRFSQDYRIKQPNGRQCFLTDRLRQVDVNFIDGKADYPGDLRSIIVYEDPLDYRHAEGYYLSVIQEPLSNSAAEYFAAFVSLINRDASIFEPPPGNLPGNFFSLTDPEDDQIYGYFYVTRPETIRIGIPPAAETANPLCEQFNFARFTVCTDCIEAGGRTVPPAFWEF